MPNIKTCVRTIILNLAIVILFSQCTKVNSKFAFINTKQGIDLYDNANLIFHYQKKPKTPDGKMLFDNYLHPLFSIDGDTITEEFPADHPHHRGIFWAWHQIFIDSLNIGDAWVMDSISEEVNDAETEINQGLAEIKLKVLWKSSMYQKSKPFVEENTCIYVSKLQNEMRIIDFQIELKGLVPGVNIGGSNDEKGYGGFCARIKNSKSLSFNSELGHVKAAVNQIIAGPWMDITGPLGKHGEINGILILCHRTTPNYPASWILRDTDPSMQNIVFPGRRRIGLSIEKPVVLRYRLIIHKGILSKTIIEQLQSDFNNKRWD